MKVAHYLKGRGCASSYRAISKSPQHMSVSRTSLVLSICPPTMPAIMIIIFTASRKNHDRCICGYFLLAGVDEPVGRRTHSSRSAIDGQGSEVCYYSLGGR